MPRKIKTAEQAKRRQRRARESDKIMPWLIILACENTDFSQILDDLKDKRLWVECYNFPLNGGAREFEKVSKDIAQYLYIHFQKKINLSPEEKNYWELKIRHVRASNENLKIFGNDHASVILPPQAGVSILQKEEIKQIY